MNGSEYCFFDLTLAIIAFNITIMGMYAIITNDNFHPKMNDTMTDAINPITRSKKWLTFSAMPSRIRSISLKRKWKLRFPHVTVTEIHSAKLTL